MESDRTNKTNSTKPYIFNLNKPWMRMIASILVISVFITQLELSWAKSSQTNLTPPLITSQTAKESRLSTWKKTVIGSLVLASIAACMMIGFDTPVTSKKNRYTPENSFATNTAAATDSTKQNPSGTIEEQEKSTESVVEQGTWGDFKYTIFEAPLTDKILRDSPRFIKVYFNNGQPVFSTELAISEEIEIGKRPDFSKATEKIYRLYYVNRELGDGNRAVYVYDGSFLVKSRSDLEILSKNLAKSIQGWDTQHLESITLYNSDGYPVEFFADQYTKERKKDNWFDRYTRNLENSLFFKMFRGTVSAKLEYDDDQGNKKDIPKPPTLTIKKAGNGIAISFQDANGRSLDSDVSLTEDKIGMSISNVNLTGEPTVSPWTLGKIGIWIAVIMAALWAFGKFVIPLFMRNPVENDSIIGMENVSKNVNAWNKFSSFIFPIGTWGGLLATVGAYIGSGGFTFVAIGVILLYFIASNFVKNLFSLLRTKKAAEAKLGIERQTQQPLQAVALQSSESSTSSRPPIVREQTTPTTKAKQLNTTSIGVYNYFKESRRLEGIFDDLIGIGVLSVLFGLAVSYSLVTLGVLFGVLLTVATVKQVFTLILFPLSKEKTSPPVESSSSTQTGPSDEFNPVKRKELLRLIDIAAIRSEYWRDRVASYSNDDQAVREQVLAAEFWKVRNRVGSYLQKEFGALEHLSNFVNFLTIMYPEFINNLFEKGEIALSDQSSQEEQRIAAQSVEIKRRLRLLTLLMQLDLTTMGKFTAVKESSATPYKDKIPEVFVGVKQLDTCYAFILDIGTYVDGAEFDKFTEGKDKSKDRSFGVNLQDASEKFLTDDYLFAAFTQKSPNWYDDLKYDYLEMRTKSRKNKEAGRMFIWDSAGKPDDVLVPYQDAVKSLRTRVLELNDAYNKENKIPKLPYTISVGKWNIAFFLSPIFVAFGWTAGLFNRKTHSALMPIFTLGASALVGAVIGTFGYGVVALFIGASVGGLLLKALGAISLVAVGLGFWINGSKTSGKGVNLNAVAATSIALPFSINLGQSGSGLLSKVAGVSLLVGATILGAPLIMFSGFWVGSLVGVLVGLSLVLTIYLGNIKDSKGERLIEAAKYIEAFVQIRPDRELAPERSSEYNRAKEWKMFTQDILVIGSAVLSLVTWVILATISVFGVAAINAPPILVAIFCPISLIAILPLTFLSIRSIVNALTSSWLADFNSFSKINSDDDLLFYFKECMDVIGLEWNPVCDEKDRYIEHSDKQRYVDNPFFAELERRRKVGVISDDEYNKILTYGEDLKCSDGSKFKELADEMLANKKITPYQHEMLKLYRGERIKTNNPFYRMMVEEMYDAGEVSPEEYKALVEAETTHTLRILPKSTVAKDELKKFLKKAFMGREVLPEKPQDIKGFTLILACLPEASSSFFREMIGDDSIAYEAGEVRTKLGQTIKGYTIEWKNFVERLFVDGYITEIGKTYLLSMVLNEVPDMGELKRLYDSGDIKLIAINKIEQWYTARNMWVSSSVNAVQKFYRVYETWGKYRLGMSSELARDFANEKVQIILAHGGTPAYFNWRNPNSYTPGMSEAQKKFIEICSKKPDQDSEIAGIVETEFGIPKNTDPKKREIELKELLKKYTPLEFAKMVYLIQEKYPFKQFRLFANWNDEQYFRMVCYYACNKGADIVKDKTSELYHEDANDFYEAQFAGETVQCSSARGIQLVPATLKEQVRSSKLDALLIAMSLARHPDNGMMTDADTYLTTAGAMNYPVEYLRMSKRPFVAALLSSLKVFTEFMTPATKAFGFAEDVWANIQQRSMNFNTALLGYGKFEHINLNYVKLFMGMRASDTVSEDSIQMSTFRTGRIARTMGNNGTVRKVIVGGLDVEHSELIEKQQGFELSHAHATAPLGKYPAGSTQMLLWDLLPDMMSGRYSFSQRVATLEVPAFYYKKIFVTWAIRGILILGFMLPFNPLIAAGQFFALLGLLFAQAINTTGFLYLKERYGLLRGTWEFLKIVVLASFYFVPFISLYSMGVKRGLEAFAKFIVTSKTPSYVQEPFWTVFTRDFMSIDDGILFVAAILFAPFSPSAYAVFIFFLMSSFIMAFGRFISNPMKTPWRNLFRWIGASWTNNKSLKLNYIRDRATLTLKDIAGIGKLKKYPSQDIFNDLLENGYIDASGKITAKTIGYLFLKEKKAHIKMKEDINGRYSDAVKEILDVLRKIANEKVLQSSPIYKWAMGHPIRAKLSMWATLAITLGLVLLAVAVPVGWAGILAVVLKTALVGAALTPFLYLGSYMPETPQYTVLGALSNIPMKIHRLLTIGSYAAVMGILGMVVDLFFKIFVKTGAAVWIPVGAFVLGQFGVASLAWVSAPVLLAMVSTFVILGIVAYMFMSLLLRELNPLKSFFATFILGTSILGILGVYKFSMSELVRWSPILLGITAVVFLSTFWILGFYPAVVSLVVLSPALLVVLQLAIRGIPLLIIKALGLIFPRLGALLDRRLADQSKENTIGRDWLRAFDNFTNSVIDAGRNQKKKIDETLTGRFWIFMNFISRAYSNMYFKDPESLVQILIEENEVPKKYQAHGQENLYNALIAAQKKINADNAVSTSSDKIGLHLKDDLGRKEVPLDEFLGAIQTDGVTRGDPKTPLGPDEGITTNRLSADDQKKVGILSFGDLQHDTQDFTERNKDVIFINSQLDGGLGEAFGRDGRFGYLAQLGRIDKHGKVIIGSKGTDTFYFVKKEGDSLSVISRSEYEEGQLSGKENKASFFMISAAEAKLCALIKSASDGKYKGLKYHLYVNYESYPIYKKMLSRGIYFEDRVSGKSKKRTYAKILKDLKVEVSLSCVANVPVVDINAKPQKLGDVITAPELKPNESSKVKANGHAQVGADLLWRAIFEGEPNDTEIVGFSNADNVNAGLPDEVIAWLSGGKSVSTALFVPRLEMDQKGGVIYFTVETDSEGHRVIVPGCFEIAGAKAADQKLGGNRFRRFFSRIGIDDNEAKYGKKGVQAFNTNVLGINRKLLARVMKKLVDLYVSRLSEKEKDGKNLDQQKMLAFEKILTECSTGVMYRPDSGQLDLAIIQLLFGVNAIFIKDTQAKQILTGLGIERFFTGIDMGGAKRIDVFTPIKISLDYLIQINSDLFEFDPKTYRLKQLHPDKKIPEIICNSGDAQYKKVQYLLDYFGEFEIKDLKTLDLGDGERVGTTPVKFRKSPEDKLTAHLEGDVTIYNFSDEIRVVFDDVKSVVDNFNNRNGKKDIPWIEGTSPVLTKENISNSDGSTTVYNRVTGGSGATSFEYGYKETFKKVDDKDVVVKREIVLKNVGFIIDTEDNISVIANFPIFDETREVDMLIELANRDNKVPRKEDPNRGNNVPNGKMADGQNILYKALMKAISERAIVEEKENIGKEKFERKYRGSKIAEYPVATSTSASATDAVSTKIASIAPNEVIPANGFTSGEKKDGLGILSYTEIKGQHTKYVGAETTSSDGTKVLGTEKLKDIKRVMYFMDGGLGLAFGREGRDGYLANLGIKDADGNPIVGSKGTDIYYFLKKDASGNLQAVEDYDDECFLISAAEAKLCALIDLARTQKYAGCEYRLFVNEESYPIYERLLKQVCFENRKKRTDSSDYNKTKVMIGEKSYATVLEELGVKVELTCVALVPNVNNKGEMKPIKDIFGTKRKEWSKVIGPMGHAQCGVSFLMEALNMSDEDMNGKTQIFSFGNGDDCNSGVDDYIAGYSSETNQPITGIYTNRAKADAKGGILVVGWQIMKVPQSNGSTIDVKVPILGSFERAGAAESASNQLELFSKIGIDSDASKYGAQGQQNFNTNVFSINMNILSKVLKGLRDLYKGRISTADREGKTDAQLNDMAFQQIIDLCCTDAMYKSSGQMDLAISQLFFRLNAIFETDSEAKQILETAGVKSKRLISIVNLTEQERLRFFSPVKSSLQYYLMQIRGNFYKFDPKTYSIVEASGRYTEIPEINFDLADPYYKEVQFLLDYWGHCDISELTKLDLGDPEEVKTTAIKFSDKFVTTSTEGTERIERNKIYVLDNSGYNLVTLDVKLKGEVVIHNLSKKVQNLGQLIADDPSLSSHITGSGAKRTLTLTNVRVEINGQGRVSIVSLDNSANTNAPQVPIDESVPVPSGYFGEQEKQNVPALIAQIESLMKNNPSRYRVLVGDKSVQGNYRSYTWLDQRVETILKGKLEKTRVVLIDDSIDDADQLKPFSGCTSKNPDGSITYYLSSSTFRSMASEGIYDHPNNSMEKLYDYLKDFFSHETEESHTGKHEVNPTNLEVLPVWHAITALPVTPVIISNEKINRAA